jgi:chorismate mutase
MGQERIKRVLALLEDSPPDVGPVSIESMGPWRRRIDEIDLIILELLNQRARAANRIGEIKKDLRLAVYAPRREEQVLEQVRRANNGPLPDSAVRHLFERIIDETRSLERRMSADESD